MSTIHSIPISATIMDCRLNCKPTIDHYQIYWGFNASLFLNLLADERSQSEHVIIVLLEPHGFRSLVCVAST